MPLMTRIVAAAGGLALTFTAGMGTASAEPDLTPLLTFDLHVRPGR